MGHSPEGRANHKGSRRGKEQGGASSAEEQDLSNHIEDLVREKSRLDVSIIHVHVHVIHYMHIYIAMAIILSHLSGCGCHGNVLHVHNYVYNS